MKFYVTIPCWSDGVPLTLKNLEAENESDAYQKAVDWVNSYAGYHYCDKLPVDTKVKKS
jgi:hypothetical protein